MAHVMVKEDVQERNLYFHYVKAGVLVRQTLSGSPPFKIVFKRL